ncbi:hypothetical protein PMIN01_08078 [Paraphaeosphaeria minitans]|uniref:Uncharacterized protein n=1 Tax=Paraphaeosphaeria minitans TaxID=565426 RepID=A0A9P6KP78_9PLEO|nr:hypothetical protein PMIN01_08078 [Paraphaeosphaeria minitans]
MFISQADLMKHQNVTPPPTFTDQPLTPPLTDKKPFAEAHRLADGEYDQIESTLQQNDVLSGYVDEKIRRVADVAFRDEEGNPVDQPGLRLRLSEFAYEGLAQKEMGEEDTEIKKRKRSETPPEEIRAGDEARYAKEEERAAKRVDHDMDYQDKSSTQSFSD